MKKSAKKNKMIYDTDPWLKPFKAAIDARHLNILKIKEKFAPDGLLSKAINNHLYYGMHNDGQGHWIFREWAPNANKI